MSKYKYADNLVYVVEPGGTQTDGETISQAYMTGRKSGWQYLLVRVACTVNPSVRYTWTQWTHIDDILWPHEVDDPNLPLD